MMSDTASQGDNMGHEPHAADGGSTNGEAPPPNSMQDVVVDERIIPGVVVADPSLLTARPDEPSAQAATGTSRADLISWLHQTTLLVWTQGFVVPERWRQLPPRRLLLSALVLLFCAVVCSSAWWWYWMAAPAAGTMTTSTATAIDFSGDPGWRQMEVGLVECARNHTEGIQRTPSLQHASVPDMRHAMHRYLYLAIVQAALLESHLGVGGRHAGGMMAHKDVRTYINGLLNTMHYVDIVSFQNASASLDDLNHAMNRYLYLTIVQANVLQGHYGTLNRSKEMTRTVETVIVPTPTAEYNGGSNIGNVTIGEGGKDGGVDQVAAKENGTTTTNDDKIRTKPGESRGDTNNGDHGDDVRAIGSEESPTIGDGGRGGTMDGSACTQDLIDARKRIEELEMLLEESEQKRAACVLCLPPQPPICPITKATS